MSTEATAVESPLERRARLRRMKILADSEKRMGRIISGDVGGSSETATTSSNNTTNSSNEAASGTGNSSSSTSKDCDSQVWSSEASDSQREHQHLPQPIVHQPTTSASTSSLQGEIDAYFQEIAQRSSNTQQQVPAAAALPPRDTDPLPRKVSLISSPIHYKTLQLSQQYNSMLSHPNIMNNLRGTSSANYFLLLLVLLAVGASALSANIPVAFFTYQLMKHAFNGLYRNVWWSSPSDLATGILILILILNELVTFIFSYVIVQLVIRFFAL